MRQVVRPPLRALSGCVFLVVWVLAAGAAHAQSGKLAGRITDEAGEPIPGATVYFTETGQGGAADIEGYYAVINIAPGTHRVRFSSIGYQTKVVESVLITSNNTTTLDVTLGEEVFEGEEVVVTAERPIVDVSLTSSMSTVSREEIDVLPVQELDDLVNLQAGVVDGHFRGGRTGEVQYQVDGVSVNNPYDNTSTLRLDRSVLQEVQVISGTFDAEYGQAMSGVVNAVLRSGSPERYEFSAETYFGDYVSTFDERFPNIENVSPLARQNYQASLSGPLPLVPSTTFLLNGQRLTDEGYMFGRRLFLPTDSINVQTGYVEPTGDGELVPLQFNNQWSMLAKLTNRSLGAIKLEYQAIGNWSRKKQSYNHAFRLNPDGTKTQEQFSIVHGLDWTHTLTDRTFYTISVRQNYFDFQDLRYDDVNDPRYFAAGRPEGVPQDLGLEFRNTNLVGVDLGRFVQRTNSLVSKGSITSQYTNVHLLKAGYEVQVSDLEFGVPGRLEEPGNSDEVELVVRTDTVNARVVDYQPVQGAAFVQDRIEWRDLRIRAGVRLEYFDANTTVPSDLANPANSIEGAPTSRPQDTSVKLRVAPRLGVSFPILEGASMFFSYGHFYQMPGLGIFFSNADYSVLRDLQAGLEERFGVLGNPDLKPEFTTQYEFGFKSEITRNFGLDLSLFYKDIRDLLGVEFVQTYTAASYARYTNVDFGGVRGFTLALDHRALGPLSVSVDYTLQVATGNSSDPRDTFNRAAAGEDPLPRQIAFNWDQRHTLNGTVSWYRPDNFALTAILKLGSGQPYTPAISSVFGSDLEPNSGRKESFLLVDLRGEKFFSLAGLDLTVFARVFNAFDEHFVNGFVFPDTGSPFYSAVTDPTFNTQLINPSRFNPPRRIEIGLSLRGVASR